MHRNILTSTLYHWRTGVSGSSSSSLEQFTSRDESRQLTAAVPARDKNAPLPPVVSGLI